MNAVPLIHYVLGALVILALIAGPLFGFGLISPPERTPKFKTRSRIQRRLDAIRDR